MLVYFQNHMLTKEFSIIKNEMLLTPHLNPRPIIVYGPWGDIGCQVDICFSCLAILERLIEDTIASKPLLKGKQIIR